VRLVAVPGRAPISCKDGGEPRPLTSIEQQMRTGTYDDFACRALCGAEVLGCYTASAGTKIGRMNEPGTRLQERQDQAALFCGADGARAGANPVAAQRALPLVAEEGDRVVVCELP